MVQAKITAHRVSKAAGRPARRDRAKFKGLRGEVRTVREGGQMCEEKEESRKPMGTDCQRVFLEASACLTHSFSHRGPHVCNGIIRISS